MGILSLVFSCVIYLACLIYFQIDVLIYSIFYSTITSISLDQVHDQNVKGLTELQTTKTDLRDALASALNRNVLAFSGVGDGQLPYTRLTVVITTFEQKKC